MTHYVGCMLRTKERAAFDGRINY